MFGINWLDPEYIITTFGAPALIVVCLIVFAETGLLAGFFLPGDSLLFVNGLFLASGFYPVPVWVACIAISTSAFLGDQTGYWIGRKLGPAVFKRPDSKLFSSKNVDRAHAFFDRYGAKAIVIAHFVPIMRTFVPVAAGVGKMQFSKFLRYNIIGVIGWGTGVTLLGYFLGAVPFVREHVEFVTLAFIVLSFIPIALEVLRARKSMKHKPTKKADSSKK
jgi:membrane-associated protein